MTYQEAKIRLLENQLKFIVRRAEVEQGKGWMADKGKIQELRGEYRRVHEKWRAAKAETALDV